jgi:hypothetical protein
MQMATTFKSVELLRKGGAGLLMLALLAAAQRADGNVIAQMGDQDFTDGQTVTGAIFAAAAAGEPFPFDRIFGSDGSGTSFSAGWTLNFAPGSYSNVTFTLGIVDHDSQASGSQLAFLGLDGQNLTSLMNAQFESFGGRQGDANIYTVTLPAAALAELTDGSATFQVTLQGPGLVGTVAAPTEVTNNGAGLDFARLTLVPEPGTAILLGVIGTALIARRRGPSARAV